MTSASLDDSLLDFTWRLDARLSIKKCVILIPPFLLTKLMVEDFD